MYVRLNWCCITINQKGDYFFINTKQLWYLICFFSSPSSFHIKNCVPVIKSFFYSKNLVIQIKTQYILYNQPKIPIQSGEGLDIYLKTQII